MEEDDRRTFLRHLEAAEGYCALDMWQDAWDELEALKPELRQFMEVLSFRLQILLGMEKWESAADLGESLIAKGTRNAWIILHTAYAVRRARTLADAKVILLAGEPHLQGEPMFHFNLACYLCQEGDLEGAKVRLAKAIALDSSWRMQALTDEDLKPLWDSLAGELSDHDCRT